MKGERGGAPRGGAGALHPAWALGSRDVGPSLVGGKDGGLGAQGAGLPLGHPTGRDHQTSGCSCAPRGWALGISAPGPHPGGDTRVPPSWLCHSSRDIRPVSFFALGVNLSLLHIRGPKDPASAQGFCCIGGTGDIRQRGHTSTFLLGWSLSGNVRAVVTWNPGRLEAMGRRGHRLPLPRSGEAQQCISSVLGATLDIPLKCRHTVFLSPSTLNIGVTPGTCL